MGWIFLLFRKMYLSLRVQRHSFQNNLSLAQCRRRSRSQKLRRGLTFTKISMRHRRFSWIPLCQILGSLSTNEETLARLSRITVTYFALSSKQKNTAVVAINLMMLKMDSEIHS
ncbi:hypothetical protein B6S08_18135 [Oceanimonas doudoroffii]|uniref:Uncharacterized protein n=1 Tax=Oceanimonas doudoroffii TaxID=84158 RepID=A0A233RAA3_9GAMM|nr:hypothetical protein B6S08_18135 [Oceanimonas doudoroffii]